MKKFNLALIGCGNQGASHLSSIINLHNQGIINFVGICDKNEKCLIEFNKLIDFEIKTSTDYQEFLKNNPIDVAILSVPNRVYIGLIEECFKKGIHVLKEKPFGLNLNESMEFISLSEKYGCVLNIAQQRRYHVYYKKAKEWISQIGDIKFLDYTFTLNDTKNSWYWAQDEGGGSWYGLGWHACFVIHYFLGVPEILQTKFLTSQKRNFAYSTDDTAFLECKYPSGTIAKALLSVVSTDKREELYISGTLGNIKLTRKELVLYNNNGEIIDIDENKYKWEFAYNDQLYSFLEKCDTVDRQHCYQELYNESEIMQMVDAGFTSAKNEGINVCLPNINFQLTNKTVNLTSNFIEA